jgi:hypothetical protein
VRKSAEIWDTCHIQFIECDVKYIHGYEYDYS